MDIVLAKYIKKIRETNKIALPKYVRLIHFDNKSLEFIHLNSILHENDIINCLPER